MQEIVSYLIRQKISSLGHTFSVNLRFEDVRKYSSVQVRDPQGVLFVPPPTVLATVLPAENPEVVTNIVQKLAALFASLTMAKAMQAQALLQR